MDVLRRAESATSGTECAFAGGCSLGENGGSTDLLEYSMWKTTILLIQCQVDYGAD